MPGSFGTLSGPVPSTTNWAVSRSPRLVSMTQRARASSQLSPVTSVWNSASSYRPNCLPMRWQCARISGPCTYFSVGMCPVSSSSGMYTIDAVSHCAPGYRFQYQVPPKSPPFSMIRTSTPASRSRAPTTRPANPPPTHTTVRWSVRGARSVHGVCGSSR